MQYGAIAEVRLGLGIGLTLILTLTLTLTLNQEGSHAELVAKRGLYYEMLNTGTGEDDDELT